MTGKESTRHEFANVLALARIVAATFLLAACGGGANGALPAWQSPPSTPDASLRPPHKTVAVLGKITSVASGTVTLQTADHHKIEITVSTRTITNGGPAHAGEFAQAVGRGTTHVHALYLAIWRKSPPHLTVTGAIAAAAADGFTLLAPGRRAVHVVLSSQTAIGGLLFVGGQVQAVGMGTLARGMVASRVTVMSVPSPSPSPSPSSGPSTNPSPSSKPSPSSSPRLSPSPATSATPSPTPNPKATPTPTPPPTPTPLPAPTVPPQGLYNSCEIDTALTSMCEPEDAAMASDGFKWEINYIGLMANKTGSQSLKAWFTYDASIGMGQVIAVNKAINDPSGNPLTGTNLLTFNGDSNLASTCGATNNEQLISCIDSVAKSVPGFNYMWYLYDEPGCPNQSLGYCQGTLAGGNYSSVSDLASYINSIDSTHQVIGTEVGDVGSQTVANTEFSWLMTSPMPAMSATGFDHYPVPEGSTYGHIDDNGPLASELGTAANTYNPSETIYYVGQAFSWYQEFGAGCTSLSVCPYPTTAQIQGMRDNALYYASQNGHPISLIFWYYWPDVTCLTNYTGCSASANRASLKAAAFAPFPTSSSMARWHRTHKP